MSKEEMTQSIEGVEEFEIISSTDLEIQVYDQLEDKEYTYRFLETLQVENLFQFNSLQLDKEKFFQIIEDCLDRNMFMNVEKVVFVNEEKELEDLLEEYPEQYMDYRSAIGIHWYNDNVIIINCGLIGADLFMKSFLNVYGQHLFTNYGMSSQRTP